MVKNSRNLSGSNLVKQKGIRPITQKMAKTILFQATAQKKTINIYNHEAGKEIPTERPVLMGLIGKPVKVAVHQITEDKTSKNDATGQYEATGATRTVNECKFFGNPAGKTAEEIVKNEDATMFDKWAEKNTGTVVDKTTKNAGGSSAADIMGGTGAAAQEAKPAGSLFA